jgi:hypothetical protein
LEHREKLEAELRAIEQWDALYRQGATHSGVEELSYQIRQERGRQITREIQAGEAFSDSFFSQSRKPHRPR